MEPTESIQDDLLILQCQQGDVRGFERLVERWQGPLLNYAYRLTGSWAVAQDMVQETWLVVIGDIVLLKDVGRFRTWLFRIASHKCQDYWRSHGVAERYAETLQQKGEGGSAAGPPTGASLDIEAAFCRLAPESRTVLALMYLEELSVGEIADVLGVPEGTVKSRLFHAREHLRQIMERGYGPD
jgi:RNA polymerase sigma-70 factor, ECF subfamily